MLYSPARAPDLLRVTTVAVPDGALPVPMSAPEYVPPTEMAIAPNPIIAPPPDGQFLGKGGTTFGLIPTPYRPAVPILYVNPGVERLYPLEPRIKPGILRPDIAPQRPGDHANVPVPTVPVPIKPAIAPTVPSATPPPKGPISGNVAGFDLARIPFLGWLVAAVVVGWKLLK